jgi:hypothetical protein
MNWHRHGNDHQAHGAAGRLKAFLAASWHAVAPPSEDFLPTLLRRDEEFHRAAAEPRRHDSTGSGEARS